MQSYNPFRGLDLRKKKGVREENGIGGNKLENRGMCRGIFLWVK